MVATNAYLPAVLGQLDHVVVDVHVDGTRSRLGRAEFEAVAVGDLAVDLLVCQALPWLLFLDHLPETTEKHANVNLHKKKKKKKG